jgi:CheY-like chemotaxis protein
MISAVPGRDSSRLRFALLVDRDDDTREMYAEYLTSAAVGIQEAADGREALARAIARRPDVVVTETRLPGMDGYELCAYLRSEPRTRTVPIVVVTGDGFQSDIDHARAAGADAVLVKPCLPHVLLAEMRRVVARSNRRPVPAEGARAKPVMSKASQRHETTSPPAVPPVLVCPACHQFLIYQRSHVGGEQWDYYSCPGACGAFQYSQRTKVLRRV